MKISSQKQKFDELNYLEIESDLGQQYLNDMEWCQGYAFLNRQAMMNELIKIV